MAKYRRKIGTVEAYRLNYGEPVPKWFEEEVINGMIKVGYAGADIEHYAGRQHADAGDFIIRKDDGVIYPCRAEEFFKLYEYVGE